MESMQEDLVGATIDNRYRVIEKLGFGGMGTVYKASQIGAVSRTVALKMMDKNAVADKDSRERFLREGKSLATLSHPNIVSFFHFGLWNDTRPYLAMELIQGEDLAHVLAQQGPFPWKQAVQIAIQCCSAMEFAHNNNIISRDLKPQNIMLTKSGDSDQHIKIIDFGLCKVNNEVDRLTQTGTLIGSVYYMSPEQCQGKVCTKQSDIYSLGCVLYELLTGSQPFSADTAVGMLHQHVHESPPSFAEAAPGATFPSGLEKCVLKAMAKHPNDRYQSMSDFSEDLTLVLNEQGKQVSADTIRVSPITSSKRKPVVGIAIGAILLLSGTVALSNDYTQSITRSIFYRFIGGQNASWDCLAEAEHMAKRGSHSAALLLCRTAVSMPKTAPFSAGKDAEFYCKAAEIALLCDDKVQAETWTTSSLKHLTEFVKATGSKNEYSHLLTRVCELIAKCGPSCILKLASDLETLNSGLPLLSDRILPMKLLLTRYQSGSHYNLREFSLAYELATYYINTGQQQAAKEVVAPLLQRSRYKGLDLSRLRYLLLTAPAQALYVKHEYNKAIPELEQLIERSMQEKDTNLTNQLLQNYRDCCQQTNSNDRAQKFFASLLDKWNTQGLTHEGLYPFLVDCRFLSLYLAGKQSESHEFIEQVVSKERANPKCSAPVLCDIYRIAAKSEILQKNFPQAGTYARQMLNTAARNKLDQHEQVAESIIAQTMPPAKAAIYAEALRHDWDKRKLPHGPAYMELLRTELEIYIEEGNFDKAERLLNEELARKANDLPARVFFMDKMQALHAKQGKQDLAAADRKEANRLLELCAHETGLDPDTVRRNNYFLQQPK